MQRLVALLLIAASPAALAIEEPEYTVVDEIDQVEIRRYDSYLVARVTVRGEMDRVANQAFDPLFGYISGGNGFQQKIDMTAPVEQLRNGDAYSVRFVMPQSFTLDQLPAPADERVELDEIPGGLTAVLRYSGGWSAERYLRHERKLLQSLEGSGYAVCGEPRWARFNPPFWPSFLRRNEVQIPIGIETCGA